MMKQYYRWKETTKDGEVLLSSERFPNLRALLEDLINETYAHDAMQTPLKLASLSIDYCEDDKEGVLKNG